MLKSFFVEGADFPITITLPVKCKFSQIYTNLNYFVFVFTVCMVAVVEADMG